MPQNSILAISSLRWLELKIFSLGLKHGLALLPLHAEVEDLHKIALGFITPLGMGHGIQQTDLKLITKNIRKNNFLNITFTYFHLLPTILHICKDKTLYKTRGLVQRSLSSELKSAQQGMCKVNQTPAL